MRRRFKEQLISIATCLFFVASFAFLIVSVRLNWEEAWQISFMIAVLCSSFIIVVYPLFKKEKTSLAELIFVFASFAILIVSVIVFASVSTDKYREPIIQVSAAVVGGLLALYGVGITIKINRLQKEKDDIEKAKPNIFPFGEDFWNHLSDKLKYERHIEVRPDLCNLIEAKKNEAFYKFAPIRLANSDLSMCTFNGIGINDKYFVVFQYNNVILKESNNYLIVDYCFKFNKEIESIQLVLGDMYGNIYSCYASFKLNKIGKGKTTEIDITSVLKTKIMDIEKYPVFKNPE